MDQIFDPVIPNIDEDGYFFFIPSRSVWKRFCEEMEFDEKYKPEDDDFVLIVRKFKE